MGPEAEGAEAAEAEAAEAEAAEAAAAEAAEAEAEAAEAAEAEAEAAEAEAAGAVAVAGGGGGGGGGPAEITYSGAIATCPAVAPMKTTAWGPTAAGAVTVIPPAPEASVAGRALTHTVQEDGAALIRRQPVEEEAEVCCTGRQRRGPVDGGWHVDGVGMALDRAPTDPAARHTGPDALRRTRSSRERSEEGHRTIGIRSTASQRYNR